MQCHNMSKKFYQLWFLWVCFFLIFGKFSFILGQGHRCYEKCTALFRLTTLINFILIALT